MYQVSKENIWNFRQNNPELVIQDAKEFLCLDDEQCQVLRDIMLARGINKWLKVRRDLIAYKKQIKHRIRELNELIPQLKRQAKWGEYRVERQELKTLMVVRGNLKSLCMTDRWQIWPVGRSHHNSIKEMNTITASGN